MSHIHKLQKNEHYATPLSPNGRILSHMLALHRAEEESGPLISGHTFGSAVAEARKKHRMSLGNLLASDESLSRIDRLLWNEIEQDRHDPSTLSVEALCALEAALHIPLEELKHLAAQHERAAAEERHVWSLLTLEAHAFRRRRA